MDVEKLIEEVRNYPVLYDLNNEKYRNTEYRNKVWKKVAEALHVAGGPAACKIKWIHIRDQFRKTLKKRKTVTGMAAGTVRKYKYEDQLQFILPQMSERDTLSNISLSQEVHGEDDDGGILNETHKSDKTLIEEEYKENSENEENASYVAAKEAKLSRHSQLKLKKIATTTALDNCPSSQLMSYILQKKKSEKQKESSSEHLHPVDAFLSGISHTLKALNPLLLNEGKTKIFGIVQELERKQIMENQSTVMVPLQAPTPALQCQFSQPLSSIISSSPTPTFASTLHTSPHYNVQSPSPESPTMLQPSGKNISP